MQLHSIQVDHFLRIDFAHIQLNKARAHIFWGDNEQGKSSLAEAIRFAVRGGNPRVKFKKDFGQLVSHGSKHGKVQLGFADGEGRGYSYTRDLPAGKTDGAALPDSLSARPDAVAIALGELSLMGMDDAARRKFLFDLCNVQINTKTVKARLEAKGVPESAIARALPLLAAGFEAAEKQAKTKAKEARGAWQETTGEEHGSKKAVGWRKVVDFDTPSPTELSEAANAVKTARQNVRTANQTLGAYQSKAEALVKVGTPEQIEELHRTITDNQDLAQRETALADEAKLVSDELSEARALYGKKRALLVAAQDEAESSVSPRSCPACGVGLSLSDGEIVLDEENRAQRIKDATAKAQALQEEANQVANRISALEERENQLRTERRNLSAMHTTVGQARSKLTAAGLLAEDGSLREATLPTSELTNAEIAAEKASLEETEAVAKYTALEQRATAVADAERITRRAAELNQELEEWARLADLFAPDGLPAELLRDALAPFNTLLAKLGEASGLGVFQVDHDIMLSRNGTPYMLLSESARWRADCLTAFAVATLADIPFVIFDRVDVMDVAGRGKFVGWISSLTEGPTVLCMATLRNEPVVPGLAAWNVVNGQIAQKE